jgi:predicted transcriptional regulator of viral defense system
MTLAVPHEKPGTKILSEDQKVLAIVREHAGGIRLVNVGNQMGVNWRSLVVVVGRLLKEGKIGRIDGVYVANSSE